ncbi:MAG: MBL fold metallo-hydrolase [Gemmatimonadaceae bacterium]|nr:MBL fold metallo-hydrolase [Gemmatimonadaceae bacterium]
MSGVNVLLDPVWSERAFPVQWFGPRRVMSPPLALEALPPLDLVLVSHSHYDHLDRPTVRRLAREHPTATWIAPLRLGSYLRGWGVADVVELDWWERTVQCGVAITATPARHFSARRLGDRNKTLWCGYALERDGARCWFAGDTAAHPEFVTIGERCGPFDLVAMPIGAYDPRWFMRVNHVDPTEAVQAVADVAGAGDPPLTLGIHWGTFRLTDEPMDEPPRRTADEWRARGWDPSRLWIAAIGETRQW